MTVKELAEKLNFNLIAGKDSADNEIESVYCCDLLSFVMGKAPAGSAWITVMSNVNVIAVASLADVACIIISEGVAAEQAAVEKANEHGIPVLLSKDPAFITGKAIDGLIN